MNDIELAQSLKAAAEKATQGNWRAFKYHDGHCGIGGGHHDEIMVCEHISKRRPHDAEFIALANPANILALVEALEKAQRYIDELREWNAGLAQESFERQQRISELLEGKVGSALLERENHHVEVVGKLTEHIDQLESRTVTVKLPYTPEPSAFAPWAAKAFYQFHKDTVKSCVEAFSDACAAAGIKVEAE